MEGEGADMKQLEKIEKLLREKIMKEQAASSQLVVRDSAPWEFSNHPLYLHHSDQPGAILVPQSLVEDNFTQWSQSMEDALKIKNKIGFINWTSQRPTIETPEEQQQWDRCDVLVKTWLRASMSASISKSVVHCKSARAVWLELQERFLQTNTVQLFNVESAIHRCAQGTDSVTAFFTKLKALWDERDVLCDMTCEEGSKLGEYIKNQKTMKFLMGLNESYAQLRGTIIAIDPLPTVNKAYSMVMRHEKQAEASMGGRADSQQPQGAVFAVRNSSREDGTEKSEKKCAKCGKGHYTKYCRAHLKCTFCGLKAHTYEYCNKRKAMEGRTANSESRSNNVAAMFETEGMPANFPFSKDECKQILELLERNKTGTANHVGNNLNLEHLSGKALRFTSCDKQHIWILDSGASDHIVCNPNLLTTKRPVQNRNVKLPDGSLARVSHIGTVTFSPKFTLHNVLCVPLFYLNLISVSKIARDSYFITVFLKNFCVIQDLRSGRMIMTGSEKEGLYCLGTTQQATCNSVSGQSSSLWHQRLGHPSSRAYSQFSFLSNKSCTASTCPVCPLAKQTRKPFSLSSISSELPFELIHVDIWGGYHEPTYTGAKYFLTIVDDYTRSTWVYLLVHKSEARPFLVNFITFVETQYNARVKIVRSDNGPEFAHKSFYASKGICHQTSCVNTPQQNGVVERKHRHLLNMARALLYQASLPKSFWGDAILTAAYLINRTPTPILDGKSPFEKLFHKEPSYSHLKVFGCLCFVSTHPHKPPKFEPRATKCVFLGYPYGKKGYRVLDLTTGKIFVSRDVDFHETIFPYTATSDSNSSPDTPDISDSSRVWDEPQVSGNFRVSWGASPTPLPQPISPTSTPTQQPDIPHISPETVPPDNSLPIESVPVENHPVLLDHLPSSSEQQPGSLSSSSHRSSPRWSSRVTHTPSYLRDFHIETVLPSRSVSSSEPASGTSHSLAHVLSYDRLSPSHRAFTAQLTHHREPTSYS